MVEDCDDTWWTSENIKGDWSLTGSLAESQLSTGQSSTSLHTATQKPQSITGSTDMGWPYWDKFSFALPSFLRGQGVPARWLTEKMIPTSRGSLLAETTFHSRLWQRLTPKMEHMVCFISRCTYSVHFLPICGLTLCIDFIKWFCTDILCSFLFLFLFFVWEYKALQKILCSWDNYFMQDRVQIRPQTE